jgi:hypothetical protein
MGRVDMITPEEIEQLERLEAKETDFYAGLMFLALLRMEKARAVSPLPAPVVADVVISVYDDLSDRINEEEDPP